MGGLIGRLKEKQLLEQYVESERLASPAYARNIIPGAARRIFLPR